ncbi:transposase [Streptomyces sp. NPDC001508]|uniref:transposase n=1 Tax=Streptomyces sp. NPDC001508 TaxID=3154656 RepID=UPI00331CC36B
MFVEQVDGLTERFARRTPLLRCSLEQTALALAERPGARPAAHLSIPTSANSLLRLVHRLPDKHVGTAPPVLGVDDLALKKGHVYGTIILAMETGERVEVLPGRTAATLTAWLRAHPRAEIVCRDRASAYAEAMPTRPISTGVATRDARTQHGCTRRSPNSASPAVSGLCAGTSSRSGPAVNPHPTGPRHRRSAQPRG